MNSENISYRKYKDADFERVFTLFLAFQSKNKIGMFHNLTKDASQIFVVPYLMHELKNLITKHKYHYVGIDDITNEIIGYACFDDNKTVKGEGVDLILIFKDEKINYNKFLKKLLVFGMDKEFPNKRIFAVLGKREKFDTYVKFIKRAFKINVMATDQFGNIHIEFLR